MLNTFVLTKLWYALECHDISSEVVTDIKDIVKTYIWNGYHQINFSALSYPNIIGGLGLQNKEYKIETLRIKWIENLMTNKDFCFERSIVNKLIGNINHIKGLRILLHKKDYSRYIKNDYYKNAYKFWRKLNINYEPCNFNSIKNDWIYDNILLTDDDGRVFKPPGYYTEDNMPHYVPRIFKDLPVQIPLSDLRGIFRVLIPKMNRSFYKIIYTNNDEDVFMLEMK